MRTSGTGYVHLKKQEWIYAKLASSISVAKLCCGAIIYLASLDDCKYWADEIALYKLSSFIC